MPDYPLTEAEAERILQLPKWIDTEPQWQQNEYGDWIMRVPVVADALGQVARAGADRDPGLVRD